MKILTWWLRIVGAFYLLQFVMIVIVKAPISAQGPVGALAQAEAGDAMARFVVDTWVTFGLEVGAIGIGLLLASLRPAESKSLVWTIIAIELARGIIADIYLISRGEKLLVLVPWLVIHTLIITTGILVLRIKTPNISNQSR